jgi:hypothetical protein
MYPLFNQIQSIAQAITPPLRKKSTANYYTWYSNLQGALVQVFFFPAE